MNFKSSLRSGAAVIAVLALGVGAAEAAPAKHVAKAKAAPAAPTATAAEVDALRATVAALQSRLDAMAAQQAKIAEDTQALEVTQDSIATSIVAQSSAINTMPATVQKDTLAALPKTLDWAKSTSVSGRMYFDFSGIQQKTNGAKVPVTGTGFDIKRFYVGVDHKFNDMFSANVTMDARYQSTTNDVQFYIKKAYLQAKINDMLTIRAGATDMPWIPFVEEVYGYRFVDKTMTENRFTFANSADWGIHTFGKFGEFVSYQVSVVDGAGYRNPSRTSGVDVEGRLSAKVPTEFGEVTAAVGGYTGKLGKEVQGVTPNTFRTADRFTALLALTSPKYRLGVEYFTASNFNSVTTTNAALTTGHLSGDKAEGVSIFGSYNFTPEWSVFGKTESVQPNTEVLAPYAKKKDDYFNIGINWEPVKIVDLALVYKRAETKGNNAPSLAPVSASYDEIGVFGQFRW
jgi:hypothetical protein